MHTGRSAIFDGRQVRICLLTDDGGSPQEFNVNDNFIVPKGFTGTWEMRGNFRELIVIEANAMAEGMKKFDFV